MKRAKRSQFPRKRKRKSQSYSVTYASLEPRNLLASMMSTTPTEFPIYAETEFRQTANLLENGDFESGLSGESTGNYDAADVAGWNSNAPGQQIRLLDFEDNCRSSVLQLDSTFAENAEDIADTPLDAVSQEIATEIGQDYIFSFEVRDQIVPSSARANTNQVEVFWNGESQGVFQGIEHWQSISLRVTADSTLSTVELREVDTLTGDGRGPLIDNAILRKVTTMELPNGDFESVTTDPVTQAGSFEGWNSVVESGNRAVPLQTEGGFAMRIDSTTLELDRVFRDIETQAGSTYFITFDLMAEGDPNDVTNELRVRWNDAWAGTFQGGEDWQSYGIMVKAETSMTRLLLREAPDGGSDVGTGQGPIIDNLQVLMVDTIGQDLKVDLNGEGDGYEGEANFTEADSAATLAADLNLGHLTGQELSSATVRIGNMVDGAAEILSADVTGTNIGVSFDASTGTLRLSGLDSVENYQQVLRSVTYENTSQNPDTSDRFVWFNVADNGQSSEFTKVTVHVFSVDTAPEIEAVSDQNSVVAKPSSFNVVATDADSTTLTYELTFTGDAGEQPPTISQSGEVNWEATKVTELDVTVKVTGEQGASSSVDFKMTSEFISSLEDLPTGFQPFNGNGELSHVRVDLRNGLYAQAPAMTIDTTKTYEAVISMEYGEIRIELFADLAPITVNNFVNLAQDGFYDGLTFHRVIADFVAQGGDPRGVGTGGPGYTFVDEVNNGLSFDKRGQLAMANAGPNTNGSQFFITFEEQPHLTGSHTIFGQMTAGDDVLSQITIRDPNISISADRIHSITIHEL